MLLLHGLPAIPAYSCSTPVFRYALEMWSAYAYRVEVIHDGNLNPEQKQALDYLKAAASTAVPANLKVIETIVDNHADMEGEQLPFVRLLFPEADKMEEIIWQGSLTNENAKKIVSSPAREELVRRIRKGDATVWLFLPGGRGDRDEEKLQVLDASLRRLSKDLKLSETATDVNGNPLDIKIINTGVHFSMISIDAKDPAEEIFIKMLLATERDLRYFKNVPMAFPVFGRGRELYALVGNGIKDKNIEKACSTVIGWCSCTIKDDNPGIDLLLKADWNLAIGDSSWIQPEQLPEITGIAGFVEKENTVEEMKEMAEDTGSPEVEEETVVVDHPAEIQETETIIEEEPGRTAEEVAVGSSNTMEDQTAEASMSPLLRNALFAMGFLLLIVAVISFFLKRSGTHL